MRKSFLTMGKKFQVSHLAEKPPRQLSVCRIPRLKSQQAGFRPRAWRPLGQGKRSLLQLMSEAVALRLVGSHSFRAIWIWSRKNDEMCGHGWPFILPLAL